MDDEPDIIWLVDGDEVPFEDVRRSGRPWLEESAAWGAGGEDDPRSSDDNGDDEEGPSELVWV